MVKRKSVLITVVIFIVTLGFLGTLTTRFGKDLKARITDGVVEKYEACGCGSCGGYASVNKVIYDKNEFDAIKRTDQGLKSNEQLCATAGCSVCVNYILKV